MHNLQSSGLREKLRRPLTSTLGHEVIAYGYEYIIVG
jgi:hypothetical protein